MPEQKVQHHLNVAGFIVAFIGAILFSTKAILVKKAFAETNMNAIALLALRMLFSLPFYLVAAGLSSSKKTNAKFTLKQWLQIALTGILGYYMSSLFDFMGLQYVSAGIERLILFFYPTFVVLINASLFKQRVSKVQWLALLLTYAGIILAYIGEINTVVTGPHFFAGSVYIVICAITYASYLVAGEKLIPSVGVSKFTAYVMLFSTAGVLAHFYIAGNRISSFNWNTELLTYGLLLAILATVIPTFMLAYGMKKIGANNTAIVTSVGPVSTILQAHWILGEPIFTEQLIGTALVIAGIILISWKQGKAALG